MYSDVFSGFLHYITLLLQLFKYMLSFDVDCHTDTLRRLFGLSSPANIVWGHAINSIAKLQSVLVQGVRDNLGNVAPVHMIEIDLRPRLGAEAESLSPERDVILSHDASGTGDTIAAWLTTFARLLSASSKGT